MATKGTNMDTCIIGAGFSGLLALRYLKDNPGVNRVTVYEQDSWTGGQWVYTDQTGPDVVFSAYKNL